MNIVCTADNKCNFSVNFINQLNEKQMIFIIKFNYDWQYKS